MQSPKIIKLAKVIWQAARSQKKIQTENLEPKTTLMRVWIRPTRSAQSCVLDQFLIEFEFKRYLRVPRSKIFIFRIGVRQK